MTDWKPCFMTTGLGSMPFTEPEEAVDLVFSTTPDLPYWPQLPARSNWEHIVMQFTNGLPVTTSADDTVEVKAPSDNDRAAMLTQFYENDLSDNIEAFALTKTTAAGFFAFLDRFYKLSELPDRLKGQLFGPLTFLQAARDAQGRMILYDTELAQACALGLGFAGAWQVENLPKTKEWPLIMIDDPGFYLVGTSNLGMSGSEAVNLLNTTIDPVAKRGAVVGVHSCAQADWS